MKWKLQTQRNLVPHKPTMKSQLISNITHKKTKPTAPKYRGKTPRFFRDGYYTRVFYTKIMTSVKNQCVCTVCVSVGAIVFSIDFSSLDHKNGRLGEGTTLSKTSSFSLLTLSFLGIPFGSFSSLGTDQLSQQILICRSSCNIKKPQTTFHSFTAQPRQSIIFV